MKFDLTFGAIPEPWQVYGDTIDTDKMKVIYSYPQCRIWAERADGSVKWSKNLSRPFDCKVSVFSSAGRIPETQIKRSDILIQLWDKRIFAVRSMNGKFTHVPPSAFPMVDKRDRD